MRCTSTGATPTPSSGGTEFKRRKLATTGKVRSFTIVHRDGPGRSRALRVGARRPRRWRLREGATSLNIPPDPEHVKLGMPVRMTTFVAGTDDDGTEAVAFAFEPE